MENILVSIRVRPLSKQEAAKGNPWTLTPQSIALASPAPTSGHNYKFDRVFGPESKTEDIYDAHTKQVISSAVQGVNGTIFAYGQTSSGKTHTMRGTTEEPGVIPLAVQEVFRQIEKTQNREFLLRVSYMEIYNEEIKDLLAPANGKVQIHENFERGIFVAGLREEIVVSAEHILALMDAGEAHRHVGETNMNVHSSRSHAIFRMVVESRDRSQDDPSDREHLQNSDPVRVSHLNLVDLAGSERVSKSGAEGSRLREGTHINKSLMTLGTVINKLSEGVESKGGHVPYRDSKLTRILQPALGGNARTVIICNITPALVHVDESRGTLHFASRANRVKNCAQVNEIVTDAALLKRQKKEIAELRQKLQNQESPSEHLEEEILNLRNELLKTELERERNRERMAMDERRIKEQEQKIENLSTMVINHASVRDPDRRQKRNNRRETWCARPQSDLPFERNQKTPSKKGLPSIASPGLPNQINRERSFGLPPPFEAMFDDDDEGPFTKSTCSPLDESFGDFDEDEEFSLPEPGPQSSVAQRRRRSSNEWIMANELEQQLLDLQGQYDSLQCDHVLKVNELVGEIEKLKRESTYAQSLVGGPGKKSKRKKVPDPGKRGKSLDAWKESESFETINQLRAQIENLKTEKLYMEREIQGLSDQAREQREASKQELEEVCEELDLQRKSSAKLNSQLNECLQQIENLQTEKHENEVALLQMSSDLKDIKSEVDNFEGHSIALESFLNESFQLLASSVDPFKEYLGEVKTLSVRAQFESEVFATKTLGFSPKVEPWKERATELPQLNENSAPKEAGKIPSPSVGVFTEQDCMNVETRDAAQSQLRGMQEDLNQNDQADESQAGDNKDCDVKYCCSVSAEQRSEIPEDFSVLHQERDQLEATVGSLRMQIQQATSQKDDLLLRNSALEEELEKLRPCLPTMGSTENAICGPDASTIVGTVEPSGAESHVIQPNGYHKMDAGVQVTDDQWQALEAEISQLKAEKESLRRALADLQGEAEQATLEKQTFILRESELGDRIGSLEAANQRVQEEHGKCQSALAEVAERLVRWECGVRTMTSKLVDDGSSALEITEQEKGDKVPLKSGGIEELNRLERAVDWASDKLKSLSDALDTLQNEAKRAAADQGISQSEELQKAKAAVEATTEENVSLNRKLADILSELEERTLEMHARTKNHSGELQKVESSLATKTDENASLNRNLADIQSELDRRTAELHAIGKKLGSEPRSSDGAEDQLPSLSTEIDRLRDENASLNRKLAEIQSDLDGRTAEILVIGKKLGSEAPSAHGPESQLPSLSTAVDRLKDENSSLNKKLAEIQNELDGRTAEILAVDKRNSEELQKVTSSLEGMTDENASLSRKLSEIQSELDARTAEMCSIAEKLGSEQASHNGAENHLSSLSIQIDRLIQDRTTLTEKMGAIEDQANQVKREMDKLTSREASLLEEVMNLKVSLQAVEDDRKLWTRVSEERLSEVERQKFELQERSRELESIRRDVVGTQGHISDLNSRLSVKEQEQHAAKAHLKALEKEKIELTKRVAEVDEQTRALEDQALEARRDSEGWQQRFQTEMFHHRTEMTSLRKELSSAKALSGSFSKEKDSLEKQLDKMKSKVNDTDAKLKTTLQHKSKLEAEKLNMERELKQLRQSTSLQRDINRRDSVADQRRQSIALNVNKTKHQLTSVEHALQLKSEEVESLKSDLSVSKESYAKLEFAMAEAESYSKEKLSELEESVAKLQEEKAANIEGVEERLQREMEAINERCKIKTIELDDLKEEFVALKEKLQKNEDERVAAEARIVSVSKEKEDMVEELLDAHIGFQKQKANLTAQLQERKQKCDALNYEIVSLTEELQKLKKLEADASGAKRILEDKLQKALESNSDMSVKHLNQIKQLEAHAESYRDRLKELGQEIKAAEERELELRMSASMQLEQLRCELQKSKRELSAAKGAESAVSNESMKLLTSNTKLQVSLDAATDRLEIYQTRWEDLDWEMTELKSVLQKAGFVSGDRRNLIGPEEFEKFLKSLTGNSARGLEAELASKKMEMVELQIQCESLRAECEKCQDQIRRLEARVLTPEEEAGLRKVVQRNKDLKNRLAKSEDVVHELREQLKAREASLNALQTTIDSLQKQNAKLQKDFESAQQLKELALRSSALKNPATTSLSRDSGSQKLQAQTSSRPTATRLFDWMSTPGEEEARRRPTSTFSSHAPSNDTFSTAASSSPPTSSDRPRPPPRSLLFPYMERATATRDQPLLPFGSRRPTSATAQPPPLPQPQHRRTPLSETSVNVVSPARPDPKLQQRGGGLLPQLFPDSERAKLSRSMVLGPGLFAPPSKDHHHPPRSTAVGTENSARSYKLSDL